jgi:hypothetical protein
MSELISEPVVILAAACTLLILGMFAGCLLNGLFQQRYDRRQADEWRRDV